MSVIKLCAEQFDVALFIVREASRATLVSGVSHKIEMERMQWQWRTMGAHNHSGGNEAAAAAAAIAACPKLAMAGDGWQNRKYCVVAGHRNALIVNSFIFFGWLKLIDDQKDAVVFWPTVSRTKKSIQFLRSICSPDR